MIIEYNDADNEGRSSYDKWWRDKNEEMIALITIYNVNKKIIKQHINSSICYS